MKKTKFDLNEFKRRNPVMASKMLAKAAAYAALPMLVKRIPEGASIELVVKVPGKEDIPIEIEADAVNYLKGLVS